MVLILPHSTSSKTMVGIISINLILTGFSIDNLINWLISSSPKKFVRTVFILTGFIPIFIAFDIEDMTCFISPPPVIILYLCGFKLSKLIFILFTPKSYNCIRYLFNNIPLVVNEISSIPLISVMLFIRARTFSLIRGSPPVILTFFIPSSVNIFTTLLISSKVSSSPLLINLMPFLGIQ